MLECRSSSNLLGCGLNSSEMVRTVFITLNPVISDRGEDEFNSSSDTVDTHNSNKRRS